MAEVGEKGVGEGAVVLDEVDAAAGVITNRGMEHHQILVFQEAGEELLHRGRSRGFHLDLMMDLPRVEKIAMWVGGEDERRQQSRGQKQAAEKTHKLLLCQFSVGFSSR